MRKIIIVSGLPNSGRDTACKWLLNNVPHMSLISYKKVLNDILRKVGWNGIEDKKYFTLRNKINAVLTEYNNGLAPTISGFIMVRDAPSIGFIVKCNQPIDINRIKKRFPKKKVVTILISRKGCQSNSIPKAQILNYKYDVVIDNNGTIEELYKKLDSFALKYIPIFSRAEKHITFVNPNDIPNEQEETQKE